MSERNPNIVKCPICELEMDMEHPDTVYGRNPATNRMAWFHGECGRSVISDMSEEEKTAYYEFELRKEEKEN